jgi:NADH pyrophosphatase NudC (nudix superfamily)
MTIFLCGQDEIIGKNHCVECDGWLGAHPIENNGFRFCDEDCIASYQANASAMSRESHVHMRDLMCECKICTAAGHPTEAERAEWAAYQAQYGKDA